MRQSRVEVIDQGAARREADLRGRLEADQSEGEASRGAAGSQPDDRPWRSQREALPVRKPPSAREEDYQLDRAIDLLRGVAMFGSARVIQ